MEVLQVELLVHMLGRRLLEIARIVEILVEIMQVELLVHMLDILHVW